VEQQAPRLQRSLRELLWQEACRHVLSFLSTAQSGGCVCKRPKPKGLCHLCSATPHCHPSPEGSGLYVCVCVFAARCWALGRIDERLGTGKGQILKSLRVGEIAG